jgi:hypothetical protein
MSETRVTAELRRLVVEWARGCCEYCRSQASFASESFSVEHIHPESLGGPTVLENLALSCAGCNGHKHAKTEGRDPETGTVVPLFHPRRQRWSDHFAWDASFTRVVGLTPTGRATVEELQLNREGLVNLRRAVRAVGAHPPPEPDQP